MYRKSFLNLLTSITVLTMTFSYVGMARAARIDLGGEEADNFWTIDTMYCKDGFSITATHTQLGMPTLDQKNSGDTKESFWLELDSSSIPVTVQTKVDPSARIAHGDGSSLINGGQPFTVNFFFTALQNAGTPIEITIERWDHGNPSTDENDPADTDQSLQDDIKTDTQVVGNCLIDTTVPSASMIASPANVQEGGTSLVSVSLNNIPSTGYTSTEFTCHYDANLVEISNILPTDLFGTDAASATTDSQNGSFIVAIAGSDGRKATSSGVAFTFTAKGLQAGSAPIECAPRISRGDNVLTPLPSSGTVLTILSLTPIPPPVTSGLFNGQVLASKTITITAHSADSSSVASVTANSDGAFSLSVPVGTYTVVASSSGFLSAQGSVALTAGNTTTLPTITLLAGDIDSNNVIDQFDAMTIGMSYNTNTPSAADLNNDGIINVLDLELLAHNYRKTGPIIWQGEGGGTSTPPAGPSFTADVMPIFQNKCSGCHGSSGGWDASSYQKIMTSGNHAPVIVPGDATNSLLVQRISGTAGTIMPPSGKLSDSEIQTIIDWINAGASNN